MNPGGRIHVERSGQTYTGILLPSTTEEHLVIKLERGYNVGIDREAADVSILEASVYEIESKETNELHISPDLVTMDRDMDSIPRRCYGSSDDLFASDFEGLHNVQSRRSLK